MAGCGDPSSAPSHSESVPKANTHLREIPTASESDMAHLEHESVVSIQKLLAEVNADPSDADAWSGLARTYHAHLLYEPALQSYQRAAELSPRNPTLQYQMAVVLERLSRMDEAIAVIEALHRWDAQYAPSHRRLADWYRQQGEMTKAIASASAGRALAPRDITQSLVLGQVLVDNGEFAKAITLLRPMLQLPAPPPFAYTLLGRCHQGLGQHEVANGCKLFSGPRPEVMPDPWFQVVVNHRVGMATDILLARSLLDQGKLDAAERLLQQLYLRDPDHVEVTLNLSTCLLLSGDLNGAEQQLDEYLQRHPQKAPALKRKIAVAVHRLRKSNALPDDDGWATCRALADAYITLYPDDYECYVYQGEIDRSRGRYAVALDWFNQAASIKDSEATAYIESMVKCMLRLNQSKEAIVRMRDAVASYPGDVSMTIALAQLEADHGEFDSAVARLEQLRVYRPRDPALLAALESMGRSNEGN
jgi:tetratricopeptide (TPR) repeat protein